MADGSALPGIRATERRSDGGARAGRLPLAITVGSARRVGGHLARGPRLGVRRDGAIHVGRRWREKALAI